LTLGTTFEAKADPLHLGAAADYAVLYIGTAGGNPINMSNPQGGVSGNVGLYSGNLNNSDVTITGRVDFFEATGTTGSGPTPAGGTHTSVAAVGTARTDALAATTFWKNQGAGINPGVSITTTTALFSTGAITVLDFDNINLGNGENLTLNGSATDVFVINIYGDITLGGGSCCHGLMVAGGLSHENVLYNIISGKLSASGGGNSSQVFGTVLATLGDITLSPGYATPRLISGTKISIVSGADVGGPTATPEPASMVLLGIGLVGTAGAIRRRRRANKT